MMEQLALIIDDLVHRAQDNPGLPQRFTLNGDLRVDVLVHHGFTQLQLSRENEFPSIREYQEILANWPFPVELARPKPVAHSGRKFLSGDWLKPTEEFS